MAFVMSFWLLVVSLRVWRIFSSSKSTNSTSTLLGSGRTASSRWLGWICQTRTRTSAGQWQVPPILSDVNRAVWLYVLGLVWPHISRLPTVCVAVYVQGRRPTTSYVQNCTETEHVSISAFHDVYTTSRVVWMPPVLCTCSIRTTTYDVVRGRTTSYAVWTSL